MGDFTPSLFPPEHFCVAGSLTHTSLFWRGDLLSGPDLGETIDSGRGPGFDGRAKRREIINDSRTIPKREFAVFPDSRSGLMMGDSCLLNSKRIARLYGMLVCWRLKREGGGVVIAPPDVAFLPEDCEHSCDAGDSRGCYSCLPRISAKPWKPYLEGCDRCRI
jgi:hypothetical protein